MKDFISRHVGLKDFEVDAILEDLGYSNLDKFIGDVIPKNLILKEELNIPIPEDENSLIKSLKKISDQNQVFRSYIGMGYYNSIMPTVIQRNILENPAWYTAYTPYQAEISQGRLEALLNFQTMINDLTCMEISNSSLLDEATSAAEAMLMAWNIVGNQDKNLFFVADSCLLQTIDVIKTRAKALGIEVIIGNHKDVSFSNKFFGALFQYPTIDGFIYDYSSLTNKLRSLDCLSIFASDILSLILLKPPGEFGADIVVGSTQRFGLPLGFGGPHSAYFATKEKYKRNLPGRLVGVSKDSSGKIAYRLALQTREQHIKKAKATSNICTSQVLLAVLSSMYAVYHGPYGLNKIASRVHSLTAILANKLKDLGLNVENKTFFDTLKFSSKNLSSNQILEKALSKKINLRKINETYVGISIDESTNLSDISDLISIFTDENFEFQNLENLNYLPKDLIRQTPILQHPVFNSYQTETKMLRYIYKLQSKDLSLVHSMISLGSCTMKLNATTEMLPITWEAFANIHPFSPEFQTKGYQKIFQDLESWLSEITGFDATSLQPNAGSQGEYAGLLCIKSYLKSKGELERNICLIPESAHGTNFASAVMAGFKVVVVSCDEKGNISLDDLKDKVLSHKSKLGSLMITYPSTHGVFETSIKEICNLIHENGGQVYMDGANMNAMVGLCKPADFGADVCHLNLHKTFCIPHGGGGPGVGPICVASHLKPFLPGHFLTGDSNNAISASPWGSASIVLITWAYIKMMGASGLTYATKIAILNANYIMKKLSKYFSILYKGENNLIAHECIVDFRYWKKEIGINIEDIAKRLIDFGFHAPTMSWPVAGTLMIEPTESESKDELDRFIAAFSKIYEEMQCIIEGRFDRQDNPLKNAPHTTQKITEDDWSHSYTRRQAAYPLDYLLEDKFWPSVGRVDNVYGDRNLFCSCPSVQEYK